MYSIKIEFETLSTLMTTVIKQDYESVVKELTELQRREDLPQYLNEDVEFLSEMLPAFEKIMGYYMVRSHADKYIASTRKKYGIDP
jgi:hypothetical protein